MEKRERGKTGRERWLAAVEQMRSKEGPIYERWLAGYERARLRERVRKGGKSIARSASEHPESD